MKTLDEMSLDELKEKLEGLVQKLRDRGMKKMHFSFSEDAHTAPPKELVKEAIRLVEAYSNGAGTPLVFNDSKRTLD